MILNRFQTFPSLRRLLCWLMVGALCSTKAVANEDNPLWNEIAAFILVEDYQSALMMLAELSTDPATEARALQQAAIVYLKMEDEAQATELLEEVVTHEGYEDDAQLLLRLYFKQEKMAKIVTLVNRNLPVDWDDVSRSIIERAYVNQGKAVPELKGARRGLSISRTRITASAYGTRYPSFDDSHEDREYTRDLRLELTIPLPAGWKVEPQFRFGHEQSNVHPEGFQAYALYQSEFMLELNRQPTRGLQLMGRIGSTRLEPNEPDDLEEIDFGDEWLYGWEVAHRGKGWRLGVGHSHSLLGDPTFFTYTIQEFDRWHIRGRKSFRRVWELSGQFRKLNFSGSSEDYRQANATLRRYMGKRLSYWVNVGGRREFRARDENELVLGTGWVTSKKNVSLFTTLNGTANLTTRERTLDWQLYLTHRGERRVQVGFSARAEVNVRYRKELFLFFSVDYE